MSRVEINSGGRHVIVDHDGELDAVVDAAEELWKRTEAPWPEAGRGTGFAVERAATAPRRRL